MHADLNNIKNNFDEDRVNDQQELTMLKKSSGHKKSHKKRHSVKASLQKNLKAHTAEFEIWSHPWSQPVAKEIDFARSQLTRAETKMEKSHENWKH